MTFSRHVTITNYTGRCETPWTSPRELSRRVIQFGGMPKDAKPLKGVGSGVLEIALRYAGDAYRTVVAVKLGEKIYVLHAFHKKSKKGIATPRHDVELIRQRYAEAKERAKREEE